MKRVIVPFFIAHRGCPHRCIFCDQGKIAGSAGRLPSAGEIYARIAAFRGSSGRESVEVAFYGGSFTGLPLSEQRGLLLPLQGLMASGEVSSVRVSTRPDLVDRHVAGLLREMGVGTVELGVQSMDDEVLALARRGHTRDDVARAFQFLQSEEIAVGAQLMPGLPADAREKSLASVRKVIGLKPALLRIYPALVIAGTPLAELYGIGAYEPLTLGAAVSLCKEMCHEAMKAGVRVTRIGLQPTDGLAAEGAILAGPYHPAFRQLVESELCFDLLAKLTAGLAGSGPITAACTPTRVSDLAGQRRGNLHRLHAERQVRVDGVVADERLSPFELAVHFSGGSRKGNMLTDLDYSNVPIP